MDKIVDLDLSFKYENSKKNAIKDLKQSIEVGKCVVLCGPSGCGKSSILRSINQLIPQFYEGSIKGCCLLNNIDSSNMEIGEVGRIVSSVFQDPRSQFFTLNSSLEVAFGLENFGYSHEEIIKKVDDAFDEFNLNYLKDRDVFELSSGERQLIAILDAYALDTDLLVLDEPTANLDYLAINRLSEMLGKLKKKNKTLVISEHRLYYLKDVADEYWYIKDGQVVKIYSKDEIKKLSIEELNLLGLRTTSIDKIKNNNLHLNYEIINNFKAKNISFKYKKYNELVLKNINIEAVNGEVVTLIGANGCGKTTFGKLASGLYKANSGDFYLNDKKLKPKDLRNNAIFIMQEAEFQFFTNSVLNELSYNKHLTKEDNAEIERLLKKLDMWQCRNNHPFELSGGQMQKLVLLLAYFSDKPIVFLDEPTAGLDYKSLKDVIELINEMRKTKIVFIISHDLELISNVSDKVISIKNGEVDKQFALEESDINDIKDYMNSLDKKNIKTKKTKDNKYLCDPRIKIFMTLICLFVGVYIDVNLMFFTLLAVLLVSLIERKYMITFLSITSFLMIYLFYYFYPNPATVFIMNFVPRIILIGTSAYLICNESDAPYTITGLRKLHVSEKVIMIVSVVFRFFPVLNGDLKIMNQSLKTRSQKKTILQKIKGIPSYIEIMIVPMIFRVLRIAETLSASCETRGIALKNKRDSFINIKITYVDIILLILFVSLIITGILI